MGGGRATCVHTTTAPSAIAEAGSPLPSPLPSPAGKQAEVLNQVIGELLEGHPVSDVKLKEVLGHTPLQVRKGGGARGVGGEEDPGGGNTRTRGWGSKALRGGWVGGL